MSIAEIIHAVQSLSRGEKLHLAHILLEDLAREELPTLFKDGQIYPIYTPEYAPAPRHNWPNSSARKGPVRKRWRAVSLPRSGPGHWRFRSDAGSAHRPSPSNPRVVGRGAGRQRRVDQRAPLFVGRSTWVRLER